MARPNRITSNSKNEILRRAQAGESYTSIAKDLGVTPAAVAYHAAPLVGSRRVRKLTEEQVFEAVRRWREGFTVAELAREFGVGHSSLTNQIVKLTNEPIGRVRRAPLLSLPHDAVDLAYLAGIIDGEGCISQTKSNGCWTVAITNTSTELESWLRHIGGLFYYPARRPSVKFDGTFNKQRFEWKVTRSWDVLRLLEAVGPFLKIKANRAEEAVASIRERFGPPPELLDQASASVQKARR